MLSHILDRLVLCPTRHPIPVSGKSRRLVEVDDDCPVYQSVAAMLEKIL